MSDNTVSAEADKKSSAKKAEKSNLSKRTLRALGRQKRKLKLRDDSEFAKAYFERKSKLSSEKKVQFRKRHSQKS